MAWIGELDLGTPAPAIVGEKMVVLTIDGEWVAVTVDGVLDVSLLDASRVAPPPALFRGLAAGDFSFNTPGGRCDVCEGQGFEKVEMQFLADVYVSCQACAGTRFKRTVREVRYRGRSVVDAVQSAKTYVTEAIRHALAIGHGSGPTNHFYFLAER